MNQRTLLPLYFPSLHQRPSSPSPSPCRTPDRQSTSTPSRSGALPRQPFCPPRPTTAPPPLFLPPPPRVTTRPPSLKTLRRLLPLPPGPSPPLPIARLPLLLRLTPRLLSPHRRHSRHLPPQPHPFIPTGLLFPSTHPIILSPPSSLFHRMTLSCHPRLLKSFPSHHPRPSRLSCPRQMLQWDRR